MNIEIFIEKLEKKLSNAFHLDTKELSALQKNKCLIKFFSENCLLLNKVIYNKKNQSNFYFIERMVNF